MTPSRKASARAAWSTTGPRDVLTSTAVGFIQASGLGVDQVPRHRAQVDVERHEVALGEQALERQVRRAERSASTVVGQLLDVVVQDLHAEALRPARDGLPDPPEPDDADRRAMDVRPEQQQRTPRLPAAAADVAVALGQPAGGGHQQRPGEVGGRLGQDARRVADRDTAPRAGGDVDVVEADGVVADDPERPARPRRGTRRRPGR